MKNVSFPNNPNMTMRLSETCFPKIYIPNCTEIICHMKKYIIYFKTNTSKKIFTHFQ